MAQIVIKVNGEDVLFSPVHVRTLEPGDRYAMTQLGSPKRGTRLVLSRVALAEPTEFELETWADHFPGAPVMACFDRSHPYATHTPVRLPSNLVVLRAVGARAARGGAR